MMNRQVNELLQREMTRQEFLTTLGFGLASLMGLSALLRMLGVQQSGMGSHRAKLGYGSSAYGD